MKRKTQLAGSTDVALLASATDWFDAYSASHIRRRSRRADKSDSAGRCRPGAAKQIDGTNIVGGVAARASCLPLSGQR
jgi:hypothetical protein